MSTSRVAIDVGGTFTDVVKLVPETNEIRFEKVPTTPDAPTRGVLDGFSRAEAAPSSVAMFTHGTTLGLNALLTRTGSKTAVIATAGFRDVFLLGRTDRRTNFDIRYQKPPALLERFDCFEVLERMLFDGSVHEPFDATSARAVARDIAARGYEAVAVAFLHSYVNPEHELKMRAVLREEAPDIEVTLSHELSREYREYERTSTAVLDAYIKPIVRRYLTALQERLSDEGFGGRFLMTRSGGGAMTASAAQEQPVNLILSGPAGGVIGAAAFSHLIDSPNMITVDMGGTSLDASLIVDHEPVLYQGAEFEQMPINTPSLYIHTIGAGGGSIAWLDDAGGLQVGPQSAGAQPGPASYRRGGELPTFTDAALLLGYLGAETPLGGELELDVDLAKGALAPVATELGLDTTALARGIIQISTTKIMGAVRAITVELGRDPKDFALLAFGGGGGLVAVDVAKELGIPTVVVPPGQGAFSALGMLMADVQQDYARTSVQLLSEVDLGEVGRSFDVMEAEGTAFLAGEGLAESQQVLIRSIDVRYRGQEHSVNIPFPSDAANIAKTIEDEFELLHEQKYGHTMDDPLEVTTIRVRAIGRVEKPTLPRLPLRGSGGPESRGERAVYLSELEPAASYQMYVREELHRGDEIDGPAVIAEHTATTVLHAGDRLIVGEFGELRISVAQETKEETK